MKSNSRSGYVILTSCLFFLLASSCQQQQNWPQFRGPESNMLPSSKELPEEWANDKNVKWTTGLEGPGWSSPVTWDGKVYITSAFPEKVNPAPGRPPQQGPPPQGGQAPQQGQGQQPGQGPRPVQAPPQPDVRDTTYMNEVYRWELACYDLSSGKELWKQVSFNGSPKAGKNQNSTYACETPVTDGKRVVAYFGMNGLYCYDMDGGLLWKKDLGTYYTQRGWGTGSSPVLYNDILFIQFDNEENSFIVAFEAGTGKEKWKSERDEKTTYSTPYIWKNSMRTELVTNGKIARSYDPATGKLLWELKTGGEQVIPSPVGNEEMLFLGNAGGRNVKGELFAVKAGFDGDTTGNGIAWRSADGAPGNPSPLLYKGLLYVIGSRGEIAVVDAATGETRYTKRINGIAACWASPWAFNDRIYFMDENGVTRVFKAGDTFEQLPENRLDGKFWSSIAATGEGYLFKGVDKMYYITK